MRFDLTKYKDVEIKSFDLEPRRGKDSLDAMARAMPPGIKPGEIGAHQLQTLHRNALVASAIVAIDGAPVPTPFNEWENYTLRTQEFIVLAYDRMNGMTVKEQNDFLEAHFGAPAPSAHP